MSTTDQELFNAALSDEAPVETTETTTAATTEQVADKPAIVTDQTGRLHDPATGKFAPKTAAETKVEAPVEGATQQQQPDDTTAAIPGWRLSEVTRERNELREQLAQLRTALFQRQQAEQPRKQEPQTPPDPFENPQEFARYAARQEVDPQLGKLTETLMYNSRLVANGIHTEEKVNAAEAAFQQAMQTGTLDQADYHKVLSNPNIFDAAVKWHARHTALNTIGGDLDGFLAKQKEAWLNDPATQAAVAERIRAQANGQGQTAPNGARPGNIVQLPPSLNKATAAAGNTLDDAGDLSSASLYAAATAR